MENLSHSLSKKAYDGNGYPVPAKTVYDDVFGGPPKYGVPTLSPRFEDYTEIFESFHASKASSIPILDLPAVPDADLSFDVRSSKFDYSEVFGGFNGPDFAVSYEELLSQSNGGDDSSDEAWTPAQSESLSDESDPSASSEKNQSFSHGDTHQSCDGSKQYNISYHKANPKDKEDMSYGMTHIAQLHAVPGFTFLVNETPPLRKVEDENSDLQITDDLNLCMDFGGGVKAGKRFRRTMSQPPNGDFGVQAYGSEFHPPAGHGKTGSCGNETFVCVSDISLKTQPSQLPPPSRQPPALAVKKSVSDSLNSKLKASKSCAFEHMVGDSSPPYFDVEIDASSSAAASAAAMKDVVEKAQAKLRSAKELMERKKEGRQCRMKLRLENDIKDKEGKMSETFDRSNCFKEDSVQGTCEKEGSGMKPYAGEERQKAMKTTQVVSGSIEGEKRINIAGTSAERKLGKECTSSQGSHKTDGTVSCREATQFVEMFEKKQVKDENILVQNSISHARGREKKAIVETFEQQEYDRKIEATTKARAYEENGSQLEEAKGVCEWDENKGRQIATKESRGQEEPKENTNAVQKVCEWKENEKKLGVDQQHGEIEMMLSEADKCEEGENLIEEQLKEHEMEAKQKVKGGNEKIENVERFKDAHERTENERRSKVTFEMEKHERELIEAVEQSDNDKRLKESRDQEAKEKQQNEAHKREENEKKQKEACEREEIEKRREEALKRERSKMRSNEAFEQEETDNTLKMNLEQEETKKEQMLCEREQNEKRLCEALKQEENENNFKEPLGQEEHAKKQDKAYEGEQNDNKVNDASQREESENEKRFKGAWEQEENKRRLQEAHEREAKERGPKVAFKEEGIVEGLKQESEWEETNNRTKAGNEEGLRGQNNDHEQTEREENERKPNLNQEIYVRTEGRNFNYSDVECKLDNNKTAQATRVDDKNSGNLEATPVALLCEEDGKLRTEGTDAKRGLEAVEGANVPVVERLNSSGMDQNDLQFENVKKRVVNATKLIHLHDSVTKSNEGSIGIGQMLIENSRRASEISFDPENANILAHKRGESGKNIRGVQFAFDQEGIKDKFMSSQVVRECIAHGRKMGDALPAILEGKGNTHNTSQKVTSQSIRRKENFDETLTPEFRENEERLKRERELENDRLRRIEEEREREIEREKDRMAVDRATCEARERAFSEVRERAERAAVERATAEVRQRVLAEARERLEKASADARERSLADKASTEARLRAERGAVERATAEARERAIEKALAEKVAFEACERVERSVPDKFYASSRSGGMRQSSLSSDMQHLQFQSMGSSLGPGYSDISVHGGVEGESAQRCKARVERHRRTAERAANALAEKNMRDHLAQKEQAERNRLAEALDAEVKRWSSGKEGNLRALLSTLQYILGPDSGWQSIPLTEVITAVAVKKAYRKATLCVHPDKLQQRSASIQQKYICEKVFDLLKEAWNKFNSEER